MEEFVFEWDPNKAASNLIKHKVSFELAQLVFYDPAALQVFDRVVDGEERWKLIGSPSGAFIVLVVVHVVKEENRFRIISARRAERSEKERYEEGDY